MTIRISASLIWRSREPAIRPPDERPGLVPRSRGAGGWVGHHPWLACPMGDRPDSNERRECVHGPYRSGLDRGTTYVRRRLPRRVTQHPGVGPGAPPVDSAPPPRKRGVRWKGNTKKEQTRKER